MAKITKAEMPALAEQIVKCLGGKENVARINHCATRLRVNPVDMEKVDKDGLKRLHGVIGIDSSKAELQIIVGAIIEDLYLEVEKITGNGGGGAIALDDQQCIFNMYGGEISGKTAKNNGGAL